MNQEQGYAFTSLRERIRARMDRRRGADTLAGLSAILRMRQESWDSAEAGEGPVLLAGQPSAAPVCLIHTAAGSVAPYVRMAAALGETRGVFGLPRHRMPAMRDTAEASLRDLFRKQADSLDGLASSGQLVLAGWSLGGVFAHGLASELESRGHQLGGLVLLDSRIPEMSAVRLLRRPLGRAAQAAIDGVLRAQAGTALSGHALALARSQFIASVALGGAFEPSPVKCPTLVVVAGRSGLDEADIELWRDAASGSFTVTRLDCGHEDLIADRWAAPIAAAILTVSAAQSTEPASDPVG